MCSCSLLQINVLYEMNIFLVYVCAFFVAYTWSLSHSCVGCQLKIVVTCLYFMSRIRVRYNILCSSFKCSLSHLRILSNILFFKSHSDFRRHSLVVAVTYKRYL